MAKTIQTVKHDGYGWGNLNYYGTQQIIAGEKITTKDENYSFVGGHRVRLYCIKNSVHWRIPQGIPLDVSAVPPANAPPQRRLPNR